LGVTTVHIDPRAAVTLDPAAELKKGHVVSSAATRTRNRHGKL